MASENASDKPSVRPVFVKRRDIPNVEENQPTVLEICLAAEKSSGRGTILGAQAVRGLWRIFPATEQVRVDLLVKGLKLRDVCLRPSDINPYILKDNTGEEKPSTKLWIDELPISVADSEIKHTLVQMGCELRSAIISERARDADKKLTRFLTGRRFVFITVPSKPLEKTAKICMFSVKLYHKEMKMNNVNPVCSKCLQPGHHHTACTSEIVCRTCRQPGHKMGDPDCHMTTSATTTESSQATKPRSPGKGDQTSVNGEDKKENSDNATKQTQAKQNQDSSTPPSGSGGHRSRPPMRQTSLRKSLNAAQDRSRSATPKRPRSRDFDSPPAASGKQARRDKDSQRDPPAETEDESATSVWG